MGMILSSMACDPSMKQTKDDRPSSQARPAYPLKTNRPTKIVAGRLNRNIERRVLGAV
jgi:hypothetical protein